MSIHYTQLRGVPAPISASLLLVLLILQGCASAPPRNPEDLCKIFEEKRSWYKASVKAQKKWGTPLTTPMAIMYQESSFKAKATALVLRHISGSPGKYRLWLCPGN